jgi:hypothetical protein
MVAARTPAQRHASRLNGARSRGPATAAGRRESSRNSTKGGFTAGSRPPEEMRAEVLAEIEAYRRKLRPADAYELRLVEAAAVANVRIARINLAIEARTAENVRTALKRWDEARADEVNALTDLLPDDPDAAIEGLRRTAEGCDRLADLWEEMAEVLNRTGILDVPHCLRFLNLLGLTGPPDAVALPELHRLFTASDALFFHRNPAGYAQSQGLTVDAARMRLPRREHALATLREFIAGQVAELEERAEHLWESYDRPAREAAPALALFDGSPEGLRLHRHLVDNERLRRRALAELARARADAARSPRASVEPAPAGAPSRFEREPDPASPPRRDPAPPFLPPPAQNEPEEAAAPPASARRSADPTPAGLVGTASAPPL